MKQRTKKVEMAGRSFVLRRLPVDVGSFIFMRMLGVSMRMAADMKPAPPPAADEKPAPEIDGDTRVRALAFTVFSGGMPFEDFQFVQRHALRCVAVVENREGQDFPMPVVTDAGEWTPSGADAVDGLGLAMKLTTEVLVLCFSDFFEESSPGTPA